MDLSWSRIKRFPAYLRRMATRGGAALIYHHIGGADRFTGHLDISLDGAEFERQIIHWKSNFNVLPFSRFVARRFETAALAICFDDGYRSVLEAALPILERHDCPAKIYLNSAQVRGELGWLNRLSVVLDSLNPRQQRELAAQAMPGREIERPERVFEYWRYFDCDATVPAIERAYRILGSPVPERPIFLTTDDVRALRDHPLIEWGSHTEHHFPLDRLAPEQRRLAVREGHDQLRAILGGRLNGFAVPFGTRNFRTDEIAADVACVDEFFVTATGERIFRNSVGPLPEIQRIAVEGPLESMLPKLPRGLRKK